MIMHAVFNIIGSGVGELLKIEELGVPKTVRNEVVLNFNIICILMMVPAGLALLAMARISRKRRLKKTESVAAVE